MVKLETLLDFISEFDWHHWTDVRREELDGETYVFLPANPQGIVGKVAIFYKGIYFLFTCTEVYFFCKEDLTDFLTGSLDECWALFSENFTRLVSIQELEETEFQVPVDALIALSSQLKEMPKKTRILR